MQCSPALRFALLFPLAFGGVGRAQPAPLTRVPELGPNPSVTDLMLAVSAVHPTFAGVWVDEEGSPGVHVNAAGPIDAPAVVALLDSLFSLNGNASIISQCAARGVAAHPVTYTYVQLHAWQRTAMRDIVAATPYLYAIAIDDRANWIELMFVKGIAPEEIKLLLTTLDAPRDALHYRHGGVVNNGSN